MNRTFLFAALGLVLTFIPVATLAAPITYTFASYASQQNGDSLNGTITTDGKIGSLGPGDILSWSYAITSPSAPAYSTPSRT